MAQLNLQNKDKQVIKSGDYVKFAPGTRTAFVYALIGDSNIIGTASIQIYPGKWGLINLLGLPSGTSAFIPHIGNDQDINLGAYNLATGGNIDWSAGNITFVPLSGSIQTYINNAAAGDTLVLASGKYTITAPLIINKELNIIGQGNAGFATVLVTPSHGTLISSSTSLPTGAFQITHDNVRIAHLSINLTGNSSVGISMGDSTVVPKITDLVGIVLHNIDVIVLANGYTQGFTVYGCDVVMRDLTFYVTSNNTTASGLWLWNDVDVLNHHFIDCFNVTGTCVGKAGAAFAYALVCECYEGHKDVTINLSNSVVKAFGGTTLDVAVASISTTHDNAIINAYFCTLDGLDYDAYQTGANELNLGGSVFVNDKIFGTVTYRAAMVSNIIRGTTLNMTSIDEHADNAAALLAGHVVGDFYRTGDTLKIVH